MSHPLPVVWTIAASDSGGGAGIQADLKTFFDLDTHGCCVVSALTAQNTQTVSHLAPTSIESLTAQLQALTDDLPPAAVKIGVLPNARIMQKVAKALDAIDAPVIYDPVLKATSGSDFAMESNTPEWREALSALLAQVDLLTPNIPEAQALSGVTIATAADQVHAAQTLLAMGATAVLIKGGHGFSGEANGEYCQDYFANGSHRFWLTNHRQNNPNTHGTGCTLSAAITAFVALGKKLHDAVVLGQAYVHQGIQCAQPLGDNRKGCVAQMGWPRDMVSFPQVSDSASAINLSPFPRCGSLSLGLYPVVDSLQWLQRLLPLGVKTIQLRVKDVHEDALDTLVSKAAALGRAYKARLFINDYWELAIKHGAYGVHLGQEDMAIADVDAIRSAGLRLGISTHSEYEWCYAATFKPSYIALGSVFPTNTKEVVEIGLDNLNRWVSLLKPHYPLVAIGGINRQNISSVLATGVGSIAVVSAITQADDYTQATERLAQLIGDL